MRKCNCGSGKERSELYDARGIFCCFYCQDCVKRKRNGYRKEVLENPNYVVIESIEPE